MCDNNGYFDLQVNGYAGVDFNGETMTGEDLHRACAQLKSDGVAAILATVITDDMDVMCNRLQRLVGLREADDTAKKMIAGIHVEGPFINDAAGYRGAHPEDAIEPAHVDGMKRLLDAAGGLTRVVTLAPERDDAFAVTRLLVRQGITVSAGHCNPTMKQLTSAIDAGLSMFTHLGNGRPMEVPRHDNVLQRVLSVSDRLLLTLIADGVHLPFFVLKNIIRLAGVEHCAITSDAMAAAGLGPGRYTLGRWKVAVGEDLVARSPDGTHLIGSAVSMRQSEANLRRELGLNDEEIHTLMVRNPRRVKTGVKP